MCGRRYETLNQIAVFGSYTNKLISHNAQIWDRQLCDRVVMQRSSLLKNIMITSDAVSSVYTRLRYKGVSSIPSSPNQDLNVMASLQSGCLVDMYKRVIVDSVPTWHTRLISGLEGSS